MVHSAEDGSIPVADMSALIARLEAVETGSAELDYLIDEALSEWRNIGGGFAVHKVTGERRRNSFDYSAPVTASLDAALALAERVLPGWVYQIDVQSDLSWVLAAPDWWAPALAQGPEARGGQSSVAKTPALALCIAILKAKAQGEGG